MSDWVDKNLELLEKHLKSKETEEYFDNYAKKLKLKAKRYERFEEWLKHNDFDKLMYRILLEHGDEWHEKCRDEGCEPYPNSKLEFIFDYITERTELIDDIEECTFPQSTWEFKGYYVQFTYGQGMIMRIYNKDDNRLLLQL